MSYEWATQKGMVGRRLSIASIDVAQQPIRATTYCAHPSICDHRALRCISRTPDQVVSLKRDPQCLSHQASLILIYRPTEVGMLLATGTQDESGGRIYVFGDRSKDVQLSCEDDLKRAMFSSIDKVTAEIQGRF
ncbi:hypothetical protein TNCV_2991821 [Trichonephila clavipes]|nr:hypothetical protein TNCV_2991821 [Trichonephila clavipes]